MCHAESIDGGSFALMGLVDDARPKILMLLDEQGEAEGIPAQMRERGNGVTVRFLTLARLDAGTRLDESQMS